MARGENDSTTTSAQRTRSSTTSRASGRARSRVQAELAGVDRVEQGRVLRRPARCRAAACSPGRRRASCADSTLTTVAPWSASVRVACGPAMDQVKSSTFRPGSGQVAEPVGRAGWRRARRRAGGPARPAPPRCARRGRAAGPQRRSGVAEQLGERARRRDRPGPAAGVLDVGSKKPRAASWALSTTSAGRGDRRHQQAALAWPLEQLGLGLRPGEGGDGGLGRLPLLDRLVPRSPAGRR